jgi:hypothetical protein
MISRTRRTAVLVLLAVFFVGIAAGWMLEEVVDDVDWPWFGVERSPGQAHSRNDPMDDDAEEEFLEGLDLSPAQHDTIDRLLDEREDRLESYWAGRLPEIEALVDSTRAEIRRLLRPDQQQAYDGWIGRQRSPIPNP